MRAMTPSSGRGTFWKTASEAAVASHLSTVLGGLAVPMATVAGEDEEEEELRQNCSRGNPPNRPLLLLDSLVGPIATCARCDAVVVVVGEVTEDEAEEELPDRTWASGGSEDPEDGDMDRFPGQLCAWFS